MLTSSSALRASAHRPALLFARALIVLFCSSRERSSSFSALRASAHRPFLLFAQALIVLFCSSRKRSSPWFALRASAHRLGPHAPDFEDIAQTVRKLLTGNGLSTSRPLRAARSSKTAGAVTSREGAV